MVSTFFEFDTDVEEYENHKKSFIEHMNELKSMSNEEHTLYKKWVEIQGLKKYLDKSSLIKAKIWTPTDITNKEKTIEEINALKPKVVFVEQGDTEAIQEWYILRVFIHSMEFEQNPGRFLRFFVIDETTGKYLGASSLGSDVIAIKCRDSWIGWNKETKIKEGKIRHTAIATTIVGTQPLGYNFLGGKLVAAMMCTEEVQNVWKRLYGETLVGLTTTSLYGKHSMYQRIPFWKELGETEGKIFLKPDDKHYNFWHHYIQDTYPEKYKSQTDRNRDNGPTTGIKQRIMAMILKEVGVTQSHYTHGFQRGVYFSPFYENTREFLRNEIPEEKLIPSKKLLNGVDDVMKWWVPKAINRYINLLESDRLKPEILYYNNGIGTTWKEFKTKYFSEIGR